MYFSKFKSMNLKSLACIENLYKNNLEQFILYVFDIMRILIFLICEF